jgi:hypothetical protein
LTVPTPAAILTATLTTCTSPVTFIYLKPDTKITHKTSAFCLTENILLSNYEDQPVNFAKVRRAVQHERHLKNILHRKGQMQYEVLTCVVTTETMVTVDKGTVSKQSLVCQFLTFSHFQTTTKMLQLGRVGKAPLIHVINNGAGEMNILRRCGKSAGCFTMLYHLLKTIKTGDITGRSDSAAKPTLSMQLAGTNDSVRIRGHHALPNKISIYPSS